MTTDYKLQVLLERALSANEAVATDMGLQDGDDSFRHDRSYYQGRIDALRDLRANINALDLGEEA